MMIGWNERLLACVSLFDINDQGTTNTSRNKHCQASYWSGQFPSLSHFMVSQPLLKLTPSLKNWNIFARGTWPRWLNFLPCGRALEVTYAMA